MPSEEGPVARFYFTIPLGNASVRPLHGAAVYGPCIGVGRWPRSGAHSHTPVVLRRCGSRTAGPSGERRAPWNPHPPRPGARAVQVGTAQPRRTRTMSTTSRWTRTRMMRRSVCCCASTGLPSRCSAWERTASDPGPPHRQASSSPPHPTPPPSPTEAS